MTNTETATDNTDRIERVEIVVYRLGNDWGVTGLISGVADVARSEGVDVAYRMLDALKAEVDLMATFAVMKP